MGQVLTSLSLDGPRPTTGETIQPGLVPDGSESVEMPPHSSALGPDRAVLCRMQGVGKHFSGVWGVPRAWI